MKNIRPESFRLVPSDQPHVDRLFREPAFGAFSEELFVKAMKEAFEFHFKNNSVFRKRMEIEGFQAEQIQSLKDVESIPWLFVQNFKEAELLSVNREEVTLVLTSSGTGGLKTQAFLDQVGLNRSLVAMYEVYQGLGILENNTTPVQYLLFTYDIEKAPNLGTAWTDQKLSELTEASERVYLIREKNGTFQFDLELALQTYERFAKTGLPVRFLGFPALMYETFLEIQKRSLPFVSKDSWVLTGGGWKNHQGEILSLKEFSEFTEQTTGVPQNQVRDLFGMTEHGVGYVSCEKGRLHVPTYAHAITRDPFTLEKSSDGGILQLFSPLQRSYPSISLLTTDDVFLDETPCSCGRSGKGLVYRHRLGLKPFEGCAVRALKTLEVSA